MATTEQNLSPARGPGVTAAGTTGLTDAPGKPSAAGGLAEVWAQGNPCANSQKSFRD